jgi:uncharacterized protein YndB with AHSA1/START domain
MGARRVVVARHVEQVRADRVDAMVAGERSGEIRVVKPGDRLRMTWQPDGWAAPAALQLTLTESASGKTAIHASLARLPDAAAREAMRTRWRAALERIAAAAG